jgi:hypothetical protein
MTTTIDVADGVADVRKMPGHDAPGGTAVPRIERSLKLSVDFVLCGKSESMNLVQSVHSSRQCNDEHAASLQVMHANSAHLSSHPPRSVPDTLGTPRGRNASPASSNHITASIAAAANLSIASLVRRS